MDVPLGTTAVELDSRNATVRGREAAIGNLIADAMRARGRADVAIMNGGGIRGGKVYPPGTPITRRDVLAELPFGNHLVVDRGQRQRPARGDRERAVAPARSRRPVSAGLGHGVEYDPQRPAGSRVLSMQVGGAPLDPQQGYQGGDQRFHGARRRRLCALRRNEAACRPTTRRCLSNEVMVYLREQGSVRTGIEGRMRAK